MRLRPHYVRAGETFTGTINIVCAHEYVYMTTELVEEESGHGHFYYLFNCKWCLHIERKFAR